jgi:hypothetical protein
MFLLPEFASGFPREWVLAHMNYLEWNSQIADHFFNDAASGRRVLLCVTCDTLAEISGLDTELAKQDFLAAVKKGPEWTEIPGCSRIGSKAHNCLHPDPEWRHRRARDTEKRDLTDHVHWLAFPEKPNSVPPYLAFLACFVLAWTERPPDFTGNDYYGPLNDLLGLEGTDKLETSDFRPAYRFGDEQVSMLDLWNDLETWGFDMETGVCYLPPELAGGTRYVDIPKYFGLLKASDIKQLPRLFGLLEEHEELDPGRIPTSRAMLLVIAGSRHSDVVLSKTSLADLRRSQDAEDVAMIEAYGGLLRAKYREFDGISDENQRPGNQGTPRCRVRLLRVLDRNGQLRSACRLRKDDAWERLSLEEGVDYKFEPVDNGKNGGDAKWIANSPWFGLMDVIGDSPFEGMRVRCKELSLAAQLVPREIVVMRQWGLPYHLQGFFLEVDDIEPDKDYVLLVSDKNPPDIAGLDFQRVQIRAPEGCTCWKTRVPKRPAAWPDCLPPLVEDIPARLSIKLLGFRLEPRSSQFPLGIPLLAQQNHGSQEIFIKSQDPPHMEATLTPVNGIWELNAASEGRIVLALKDNGDHAGQRVSDCKVDLVDIGGRPPCEGSDWPIQVGVATEDPCPSYPNAKVQFVGGTPAPLVTPNPLIYLASNPPKGRAKSLNIPHSDLELLIDGKPLTTTPEGPVDLFPPNSPGEFQLECRWCGIPLDQKTIYLTTDPQLRIRGISDDPAQPTPITDNVCATVSSMGEDAPDYGLDYAVVDGDTIIHAGSIITPFSGIITRASESNLKPGRNYKLRFQASGTVLADCWFTVRSQGGQSRDLQRGRGQGINTMADALSQLNLPGNGDGGDS